MSGRIVLRRLSCAVNKEVTWKRWALGHTYRSPPSFYIIMAGISGPVLWTRHCAKCLTWIFSLGPFSDPLSSSIAILSFVDGEPKAPEQLATVPKATQLASAGDGTGSSGSGAGVLLATDPRPALTRCPAGAGSRRSHCLLSRNSEDQTSLLPVFLF